MGIVINWLKSYLNNTKQCVEFKNNKFSLRDVACGVPHGSILGPLKSVIYINKNNKKSLIFKCHFSEDS